MKQRFIRLREVDKLFKFDFVTEGRIRTYGKDFGLLFLGLDKAIMYVDKNLLKGDNVGRGSTLYLLYTMDTIYRYLGFFEWCGQTLCGGLIQDQPATEVGVLIDTI